MSHIPPRVWSKRARKYPADAVYVGRPSPWGNPFVIGRDGTRKEVIQKYRERIERSPALVESVKRLLRGKHLLCWCAPHPCHADVLLEIANED